ncbi:hypothetical protein TRIATDRAFT_319911 [Trichoderma atroviride IMI 206040]|uniref:Uncharacterized protein n=1 Tax=Hypocrea atroviridis (strain ATCC 20476 / IMI 206040) TaxID=452589 RepID=G9P186_HYPAI|nr:uncharacterized protein TRIATDRAFT_319911 [Trichoderma atroviride IMI 206040]EHK42493.1 hypothetical protein TRIATDRAFT_319911 [Trichoderma atroviride IMI 206040]
MDRVWFKLRQTHYSPSPVENILAGDGDDSQAPLCLGHCIADLKHLDFPINAGAVVAFPQRMAVFSSHIIDFKWERKRSFATSLALATNAPVAAALGLATVKASVSIAFKRSVSQYEEFSRLDTYIVQPTRRYVEQCLERDEVKNYIGHKGNWSFFMITGLRVARAGKRLNTTTSNAFEINAGPNADILNAATGDVTSDTTVAHEDDINEGQVSDFVWAIRLAKIHKGILMTDWSIDPYTRRATFSAENNQHVDVGAVVENEGLESFQVVEDDDLGEAIVLDEDQWTMTEG